MTPLYDTTNIMSIIYSETNCNNPLHAIEALWSFFKLLNH